jgi:hypothetical protein
MGCEAAMASEHDLESTPSFPGAFDSVAAEDLIGITSYELARSNVLTI